MRESDSPLLSSPKSLCQTRYVELDPQAAVLVALLRSKGVVNVSQLTVAGARREGLHLAGTWALDDDSVAIVSHVSRLGRMSESNLAAISGIVESRLQPLLENLRFAGYLRRREDPRGDTLWEAMLSGRRRSSPDVTGALASLAADSEVNTTPSGSDGVRDHQVLPGVEVRVYRPVDAGEALLPVVFFVHGGGYVSGSIESYNEFCLSMVELTGFAVVSVGYRLAPEHRFPTAYTDTVAALHWLVEQGASHGLDAHRLAAMGDSAGAALCTSAILTAHREGWARIALQVLLYPALDTERSLPSYQTFADGPLVSAADMEWFYRHYAAPPREWTSSPIHAPDLSGSPPALILAASIDPMHDDGVVYAQRLRDAGVEVQHVECDGMFHGFILFSPTLDGANRARKYVAAELQRALNPR